MEKISKIFAYSLDRKHGGTGDGGSCKVVAFYRNNELIVDTNTISSYFKTDSKIFSERLYNSTADISINQLLEFSGVRINDKVDEGFDFHIKYNSVKRTGNLIIDIPSDYIQENYIDLAQINNFLELNKYLDRDLGYFYLCDTLKLYGPFRILNNVIQSKEGKHVYSFEYFIDDLIEIEDCDFSYIINDPKNKFGVIDCMSDNQLIDFLKDQLTIDRADINLIKKTADQVLALNKGRTELDTIRLSRASKVLSALILSYDELKKISQKEHDWSQLIKKVIDHNKGQIKNEAINEIKEEILKNNTIKDTILKDINTKKEELDSLNRDILELSNQYDKIQKNKEDLILAIQITAGSPLNKHEKIKEKKKHYFEILAANNPSNIDDLDEFYDQCLTKVKGKKELKETLYILKEKKFIVGNSVELVLNAIQHIGSYQIMLQNTEADWLKYRFLEINGFRDFSNEALNNPEVPFFFILQDFNMASFECYGKPINDVANRIRKNIPGTSNKWPDNLYFIIIKLQSDIKGFGFDLNKETFSNWCFLPEANDYILQNIKSDQGIDLKKLQVYSEVKNFAENYLS